MKLAWATDIHLDHASDQARREFYEAVRDQADALVVSGDIAESDSISHFLTFIAASLELPVYFVLGNHDFYRGSVAGTRREVAETTAGTKRLVYLSQTGAVELTPNTALVGHDGWGDARLGNFDSTNVILNDFLLIDELRHWQDTRTFDKPALRQTLQNLGDEAARHLGTVLPVAAERYSQVIVVTHVPPFREAAWHEGRHSGDDYLPFFSCKAVGDVLLTVAQSYPRCDLLALCGHTHGGGEFQVLENLRVWTGAAEYGKPNVQKVLLIE